MRNTMIFSLAFFFAVAALAQPAIVWQKSLGGNDFDWAYSIQQTDDGGFIVAGYSESNDGDVSGNRGSADYWVVKLNSAGEIEWQRSLGGSGDDVAYSIQQTSDGGFIVAGRSNSNDGDVSGNHGSADYWVVKLNSSGEIVWQTSLGGSSWDFVPSIQQTADGGFIVAGGSTSNDGDVSGNHGGGDYWVVKLNSAGEIEWQRSLGGSSYDAANSIQQTSDGGFVVAGGSYSIDGDVSGNHGSADYWVVKLNSAGEIVWQKCLGGSDNDLAFSIQQTADGGFIIAGYSCSNDGDVSGNHGSRDYWVVKLNSAGEIEWQKCLGGSGDDEARSIHQTADGGFIVAGYSESNDGDVSGNHPGGYYESDSTWHEYPDYWVVKLNSFGEIVWQKSLGGSDYDEAFSIQQITDGGFIIAGVSYSNDGDVSGHHGSTDYSDYWIVKLSPEEKITKNTIIPEQFEINVFPNPFNSSCAITVSGGRGLACQTPTEIAIYDLRGNLIATPCSADRSASLVPLDKGDRNRASAKVSGGIWTNEQSASGASRGFIWRPDKSIASGIYLVRATTEDGQTITKRVVYLK